MEQKKRDADSVFCCPKPLSPYVMYDQDRQSNPLFIGYHSKFTTKSSYAVDFPGRSPGLGSSQGPVEKDSRVWLSSVFCASKVRKQVFGTFDYPEAGAS